MLWITKTKCLGERNHEDVSEIQRRVQYGV